MFLAAIAAFAAPVAGSLIASNASQNAANTQAGSADYATQVQQQMYNQTTANVAPWLQSGQTALSSLMSGVQNGTFTPQSYSPYTPYTTQMFQNSPEYQAMQQSNQTGIDAAKNASSIAGGSNSNNLKSLLGWIQGNALSGYGTALSDYMSQYQLGNQATQLNNQNIQQQFSNLSGISGTGLSAGLQQGKIGADVGQSIGSNIIGAGNATAAGQMGSANAIVGGINSAYNNYLQQQYLNQNTAFPEVPYQNVGQDWVNASDRRLKEDIVLVGETNHGLNLYEFSYKSDPVKFRFRGVMSDEVRAVMPNAVIIRNGYDAVRYDMLGIRMEAA